MPNLSLANTPIDAYKHAQGLIDLVVLLSLISYTLFYSTALIVLLSYKPPGSFFFFFFFVAPVCITARW